MTAYKISHNLYLMSVHPASPQSALQGSQQGSSQNIPPQSQNVQGIAPPPPQNALSPEDQQSF